MQIPLSAEQSRELGGLLLSCAQVGNTMQVLRAAQWRNSLAKVGLPAPFWVVHDLGLVLTAPPDVLAPRKQLSRV